MKTSIFLLALLPSASIVNAAKPAAPQLNNVRALPATSLNRVAVKPAPVATNARLGVGSAITKSPLSAASLPRFNISRTSIPDSRTAGFRGACGAGRDVANAVRNSGSIRGSLPQDLREFGVNGNLPRNSGFQIPNFGSEGSINQGGSQGKIQNPQDRFSNAKPRDIRGAMSGGSRAGEMDTDGCWPMPNGYMGADGSTHTVTGSGHQSTTRHYNPDGKYAGHSDETRNPDETHRTTQHYDSEGCHTSTVVVETRRDGTEQKTVYREGQAPVITNSDDTTRTKTTDRSPSEGASLGGASRPGMKQVSGLTNLDLLRQFAEGQSTTGSNCGYFVSGGARGLNQTNPVGESSRTGSAARVVKIDPLNPEGGGNSSEGGNNRPN